MIALFGLEEFAARRTEQQQRIEARIRDEVERAVDLHFNTRGWDDLIDELKAVFAEVYEAETGESIEPMLPRGTITQLRSTLRKTKRPHRDPDQNSVNRITASVATYILNLATAEAVKNDPETLVLEWVHMDDNDVRTTHREAGGQRREVGDTYDVGGFPMRYPGDPRAPIELWINCRCVLRPVEVAEVSSESEAFTSDEARDWDMPDSERDDETISETPSHATLPEGNTSTVVVALPAEDEDVHEAGEEPSHVTLAFLGEPEQGVVEAAHGVADNLASTLTPFYAGVSGYGVLGPDRAKVLFTEAHEFNVAHGALEQDPAINSHLAGMDTHPHYVPHLTMTYGDTPPEVEEYTDIRFDRLAVWHGDEQTEYPLGETMPEKDREKASFAISDKPWDGSPSRFTDEEYKRSCILHKCDGMEKSCHSLPIKEPNGDLNRNAVHNAASRLGSVDASPEAKSKAKSHLRGAYKQLGEEPPDNIAAAIDWEKHLEDWMGDELTAAADPEVKVPWHGVLAPEGVLSGDGRGFKEGSLRHRDLPLPLTWQKISDDGHKGNVTIATIESIEKVDGELRAEGYMLNTPEADEVAGLIGEFGRFGVSVDADDSTYEVDEEAEAVWFSDARVCSACVVPIPAFAEAWVALGTWADHDAEGHAAPEPDTVAAAIETPEQFVDVAPGRTEDGPGWLTHPVDTDRLRDYWVRGPGAAKIGWGSPGDFDRCRTNVAEYVKPQHLNGYCANRHYDALGFWPGRNAHAAETLNTNDEPAEALSMVASIGHKAPADWFKDPKFAKDDTRMRKDPNTGSLGCPLTVTDDGQVYGHLATWGTCHIGFDGQCIDPPHSKTAYAYFMTGETCLDDGERVPVGNITIGGGHAPPRLGLKPALAHYDSTSAVVADVTCGEDEFGIWVAGWIRPGADDDMVTALRASALSGDWRRAGSGLELVAALAVNVPGFGIPRTQIAASAEGQLSLVAAGVVQPAQTETKVVDVDYDRLADAIHSRIVAQSERREKMKALAARVNGD